LSVQPGFSLAFPPSSCRRRSFDLGEHLSGLGQVGLKVTAHHVENLRKDRVPEGIEHLVPFLPIPDDLTASQNREMLGEVSLLNTEAILYGAGGEFALF